MNTKYTNTILTIIAGCLLFQVISSLIQKQKHKTGTLDVRVVGVTKELPVTIQNQRPEKIAQSPLEVKVVSVVSDIPVTVRNQSEFKFPSGAIDINIKSIGGDWLRRVGGKVTLPVNVENTVNTKIVGPMFFGGSTGYEQGVGVVLLNR